MFNLTGKVAFVSGSSRGIGKAIAMALGTAGAEVIFHGTKMSGALRITLEEARAAGIRYSCVCGDLGADAEVADVLNACTHADILVLNASVQDYVKIADFSMEEFEREFKVNVAFNFKLLQHCLPQMKAKNWGRILAIGSVNGVKPSPRLSIYSTTKSALSTLMGTCAREYAEFGITANTLSPGVITTDRNAAVLSDAEFSENLRQMIPARRFGTCADCVGPALLLCSEEGSYITGAELVVAGGLDL